MLCLLYFKTAKRWKYSTLCLKKLLDTPLSKLGEETQRYDKNKTFAKIMGKTMRFTTWKVYINERISKPIIAKEKENKNGQNSVSIIIVCKPLHLFMHSCIERIKLLCQLYSNVLISVIWWRQDACYKTHDIFAISTEHDARSNYYVTK